MRSDLDAIMEKENIDALWVMGDMSHNADMVYFTGVHDVRKVDLFKIAGKPAIVYHFVDMEREEAAKSGLETHSYDSEKPLDQYLKKYKGDLGISVANRLRDTLSEMGLTRGRIAVSGQCNIQNALNLLQQLKIILPEVEFIGFIKDNPIQQARMTKEPDEIERIRSMAKITIEVVGRVADFLIRQRIKNNILIDGDGIPIRIKDIKNKINLWLTEFSAENPEGTIFSIGRDAGVPHNSGNPEDLIEIGKPIVFDISPCEKGGGYFFDFTRTWCLDHASDEMIRLHQQVMNVHHQVLNELEPGKKLKEFQARTCHLFSKFGHRTVDDLFNLTEGYVHSVSHGLGLDIHESPLSGITAKETDILQPGVVFTVEPGLYYPSKDLGVRIEDTVYLSSEGKFELLAEYPYDLILHLKN